MEKSSYFLEIFGGDDLPSAPQSTAEPVTMLDDLFEYLPGSGAASLECQRLQDDAFGGEICGMEPAEFRKAATSSAPAHPGQRIVAENTGVALGSLLTKAVSTAQRAPEHRRAMRKIVDQARSKLRKYETGDASAFDVLYNSLTTHAADFVSVALIAG